MKTGLFSVFDSQKSKDRTAGPVFSSLGPVWLQSFCGLETGLPNTKVPRDLNAPLPQTPSPYSLPAPSQLASLLPLHTHKIHKKMDLQMVFQQGIHL
jgi:hypothetical protein